MKKTLLVLLALLLLGGGAYLYRKNTKDRSKKKTYISAVSRTGSIADIVDTTGEVAPLNRVEIMPSVSGRVDKLLVEEGAVVKQGQVLAYISSSDRVAILDAARAKGPEEIKYWEDAYKATPVVSPLNGKVILRDVVEGQTVNTSSTLFALSDELIIKASVDEADIGRVKLGQDALCTLDAYPDSTVSGRVFQILHEGKNVNNVITYYAKIKLSKVPQYFKSQMTANIKIVVSEKSSALLLPSVAVSVAANGGKYVLSGTPPENLQRVPVTVGLDDGNNAEILSGLQNGATVYYSATGYTPQKQPSGGILSPPGGKASKKDEGEEKPAKISGRARNAMRL
ncbi:MAG: HlyD family efflux transporter periplasmic adaptor subunit [Elusimicrobia bacterium]|nr:HlyD family efflux transporter periplasmic adaptor subunit [Elusimicrobiota bacterium]